MAATTLDATPGQKTHRQPWFLPDGKHFLFQAMPAGSVWVGSLDGQPVKKVVDGSDSGGFFASGFLLFVRQQTLVAQPFDPDRLVTMGEPVRLAEDVRSNPTTGRAALAVSQSGVLVYRPDNPFRNLALKWVDRKGSVLATVPDSVATWTNLRLAPDGRRVLAHIHDLASNGGNLWMIDVETGIRARATFGTGHDQAPVWSPDEAEFAWDSTSPDGIHRRRASGTGDDRLWIRQGLRASPTDWSKEWLIFSVANDELGPRDIWFAPVADPAKARPYLQTEHNEALGRLSPDGKFLAYVTNESGRSQVFIRTFPDPNGGRWLAGEATAQQFVPLWRRDGRELFLVATRTGTVHAVDVRPAGAVIEVGPARLLFDLQQSVGSSFDVAGDGQRFLVALRPDPRRDDDAPLTVVVNWPSILRGK